MYEMRGQLVISPGEQFVRTLTLGRSPDRHRLPHRDEAAVPRSAPRDNSSLQRRCARSADVSGAHSLRDVAKAEIKSANWRSFTLPGGVAGLLRILGAHT